MTQQTVTRVRTGVCGICGGPARHLIDGMFRQCDPCFNLPERRERIHAEQAEKQTEAEKRYRERAVEYAREAFVRHLQESVLNKLDSIKRDITRSMAQLDTGEYPLSATDVVRDVQHEILWGLANMGLDNLVRDATRLEEAQRAHAADKE